MGSKWTIQNWTTGELNALVKNLGGEEIARKIQRGEVGISLEDILKVLFDKNGRCIPPHGLKSAVCDPDRDFHLYHLQVLAAQYANRILLLHSKMGIDTGITAKQFQQETERLLALIRDDSQIANIANGVGLPIIMPKLETNDLGTALKQYLIAVGKSYTETFSDRKFCNYKKGTLAGKVSVFSGSRHDQLIERMKQGPVIGIHFPNPLQGFSPNASREQMTTLLERFILSGLDIAIAMVMYPDVLARDGNTPGLGLAALSWQSAGYSLLFRARDDGLDFYDAAGHRADANDRYSDGLLFVG